MSEVQQLADDLHFVRNAVKKAESSRPPPRSIPIFWAAYVLIGYTLIDLWPSVAGAFFSSAVSAAGFCSYLGSRAARKDGMIHRTRNGVDALRGFCSFVAAYLAAVGLSFTLPLGIQAASQVFVVLIGMVYLLAGLYGPRYLRYMLIGEPLVMAGGICVSLVPHLGWTCLGILIASCIITPVIARPRETHAAV